MQLQLFTFREYRALKLCMHCTALISGPGPAGWTGRGSPTPGLAVGRHSRAFTAACTRLEQPLTRLSRTVIRGYSTYRQTSCRAAIARYRPQQSGTGPTSPWPGPALVTRASGLEAVRHRYYARGERPGSAPWRRSAAVHGWQTVTGSVPYHHRKHSCAAKQHWAGRSVGSGDSSKQG